MLGGSRHPPRAPWAGVWSWGLPGPLSSCAAPPGTRLRSWGGPSSRSRCSSQLWLLSIGKTKCFPQETALWPHKTPALTPTLHLCIGLLGVSPWPDERGSSEPGPPTALSTAGPLWQLCFITDSSPGGLRVFTLHPPGPQHALLGTEK